MSREIKFRAWDKVTNEMVSWEDDLHKTDREINIKGNCILSNIYNAAPNEPDYTTEEHETILMQYTGLKDKNGKDEIWEDSVITFIPSKSFGTTKRQTARVYYCEKRAAFCVKSKAWDMPIKFNCEEIEVIGNIRENSSLLDNR